MGDMLLKHKRPTQWQSTEMLARKPWPPIYPQRVSPKYHLHPSETHYAYAYTRYNNNKNNQSGGIIKEPQYFMAPYYRNVMPPPPSTNRPFMDRTKRKVQVHHPPCSPCRCKSKSLEDVRADVVEVRRDYDDDFNGNRVLGRDRFGEKRRDKQSNGRSMDNLTVDVGYSSPRWIGSYQVCLGFVTKLAIISRKMHKTMV